MMAEVHQAKGKAKASRFEKAPLSGICADSLGHDRPFHLHLSQGTENTCRSQAKNRTLKALCIELEVEIGLGAERTINDPAECLITGRGVTGSIISSR